ncbi:hypothetical protein [Denitratisoma oestradiolicum]|uniref:Uncharacterized protein n=1 Tax=Denitratisoma oestradiolicum TaxID=311182 RepID=A0A6S6Y066_9PROT|nr:hypothetical protein [Denitratisoma oestradiolicum]TWO81368.1 hypothetical protein CBW56_04450 [Denitratisoma oestradiolicum]CAB1368562.1 exported protein of unknown function [Denitratisoma oestradiolicum]
MSSRSLRYSLLACAWALGAASAGAVADMGSAQVVGAAEPALPGATLCASLSPEQREQMRSQIREYREQMSAEQQQQRREKMRERRESMSPEEKQLLRERIREHRRQREAQRLEAQ